MSSSTPRFLRFRYGQTHRELPIEAGFVGRTVQTTRNEIIEVKLQETDSMEKVLLVEKET